MGARTKAKWLKRRGVPKLEVTKGGCWEWTGARNSRGGYGNVTFEHATHKAHRLVYEALVGPVPKGLEPHHLCENPPCCNPDHLLWVTHAVNCQLGWRSRRTHCDRDHPLSGANLRVDNRGSRICRRCESINKKARKARA